MLAGEVTMVIASRALPRNSLPLRNLANELPGQPFTPDLAMEIRLLTAGGSSGEIKPPSDFTCRLS